MTDTDQPQPENDQPDAPAASDPAATDLMHYEDFPVGETVTFGRHKVTRDEIVAFATEFDPQPFHLDEDAGSRSLLGGLAASGWHTCAMLMRMICDGFLNATASLGSPGVDEVKWLKPVRPGDTLTARRTCLEARPSASRPEMGLVKFHYEVSNQAGDTVMTWLVTQLFRRRDHAPATASAEAPPETDDVPAAEPATEAAPAANDTPANKVGAE